MTSEFCGFEMWVRSEDLFSFSLLEGFYLERKKQGLWTNFPMQEDVTLNNSSLLIGFFPLSSRSHVAATGLPFILWKDKNVESALRTLKGKAVISGPAVAALASPPASILLYLLPSHCLEVG